MSAISSLTATTTMPVRTDSFTRWLREPIVHFLVIGALLFFAFRWQGDGRSGSNRIVITPGQIDSIAAGFARTWQRPPTERELKAQLDEYLRDEIATREAVSMGLDNDDTIIRRRLRQKLEFMAEETLTIAPPTEADLQSWLDAHVADYRADASVAFRQVMLSPERRGASLESDARALRARLAAAGADADIDSLGDSAMIPSEIPLSSRIDVARLFGEEFADAILKVAPRHWAGPIESGYGLHVVFVLERNDSRTPTLADVRQEVERDFTIDRRKRQLDEMYSKLLQRYTVVIEKRPDPVAGASPSPEGQR